MAKSKKKKNRKVSSKKITWQEQIQATWTSKSPIIRFLLGFLLCIIAFYLFYYSSWYENNLRDPLLSFQANLGGKLINLLGYNTNVRGESIVGEDFAMNIKNGCDGLEATVLFLAAVLMFPLSFRWKWPGLVVGLIVLSIANLFRIAGLYVIGVHWKSAFNFFHLHGGLVLFMVLAMSVWLIWISWALKKEQMTTAKT